MAENGCTLSLTSVCYQILEHVVCKHIWHHIDQHISTWLPQSSFMWNSAVIIHVKLCSHHSCETPQSSFMWNSAVIIHVKLCSHHSCETPQASFMWNSAVIIHVKLITTMDDILKDYNNKQQKYIVFNFGFLYGFSRKILLSKWYAKGITQETQFTEGHFRCLPTVSRKMHQGSQISTT